MLAHLFVRVRSCVCQFAVSYREPGGKHQINRENIDLRRRVSSAVQILDEIRILVLILIFDL